MNSSVYSADTGRRVCASLTGQTLRSTSMRHPPAISGRSPAVVTLSTRVWAGKSCSRIVREELGVACNWCAAGASGVELEICRLSQWCQDPQHIAQDSTGPLFPRSGVADCGFDEGPCLSEQRTNTVIRDPDVRYEKRWPRYMDNVRQHGLRSIFAVPVELHDTASAAMNFYTVEPGEFVEDDAVSAQRYADVASTVLGIAVPIPSLAETAEQRWNRGPQSTWLRASS